MEVLRTTPLNPIDNKIPDGLRYHVVEIYVDELEKIGADEDGNVPLEKLLQPLHQLEAESRNKTAREKVSEALDDRRVRRWKGEDVSESDASAEEVDEKDNEEWGGIDD